MGTNTEIAWTDHTANFWIGCTKVAQGCKHCYAENFAKRVGADVWGPSRPRRYVKTAIEMCHRINRAAEDARERPRIFVSSLSDFFDDSHIEVLDHFGSTLHKDGDRYVTCGQNPVTVGDLRRRAWETIDACPNVDFLILTKRPESVRMNWPGQQRRENCWLGVSAATDPEYAEAMTRLANLRDLARYTFISAEPMIENIRPRLTSQESPDWVIVGGESGGHARPCYVKWIRAFVKARHRNGARLFVKQLGGNVPDCPGLQHPKGGIPEEWPPGLNVREFPGPA
jgi:protein gp37